MAKSSKLGFGESELIEFNSRIEFLRENGRMPYLSPQVFSAYKRWLKKKTPVENVIVNRIEPETCGHTRLEASVNPMPKYPRDIVPVIPYPSMVGQGSNLHNGQYKLAYSEIKTLIAHNRPLKVLYIGAAPGQHICAMVEHFGEKWTWFLYDPKNVDTALLSFKNVKYFKSEFKDSDTSKYLGIDVMISDIRSDTDEKSIWNDMLKQKRWFEQIKPKKCLLKFRMPYDREFIDYLPGDLYLQVAAPQLSGELRLRPTLGTYRYKRKEIEDIMSTFNNLIRPSTYVAMINQQTCRLCYDCMSWKKLLFKGSASFKALMIKYCGDLVNTGQDHDEVQVVLPDVDNEIILHDIEEVKQEEPRDILPPDTYDWSSSIPKDRTITYETAAIKDYCLKPPHGWSGVVFEFGCGQGANLNRFSDLGATTVYGIDIEEKYLNEYIRRGLKLGLDIFVHKGDFTRLNFESLPIFVCDDLEQIPVMTKSDWIVVSFALGRSKSYADVQKFKRLLSACGVPTTLLSYDFRRNPPKGLAWSKISDNQYKVKDPIRGEYTEWLVTNSSSESPYVCTQYNFDGMK